MIVVDLETSGLDQNSAGIWQIGAVEIENPKNYFFGESSIDDSDMVENEALIVTGKTESELRDKRKQTQRQLICNFFEWILRIKNKIFMAQNTPFDFCFLLIKSRKYGLKFPFKHRSFDLHTFAALKYFQVKNRFMEEKGGSSMGLTNILEFCGMKDERISLRDGHVDRKGSPHNALEDAKLEAECFSRMAYGRNLLEEYKKFPLPDYLNAQN